MRVVPCVTGTSNDTELEKLKKRLQFVMYRIEWSLKGRLGLPFSFETTINTIHSKKLGLQWGLQIGDPIYPICLFCMHAVPCVTGTAMYCTAASSPSCLRLIYNKKPIINK